MSKFQKYTPLLQIYDLPFLFKDMAAIDTFQQGPNGRALLASMKDKGIVGLEYLHNGMKQISANDPIHGPGDAKNKKFRIMTSDVLAAQFEAVGAIEKKTMREFDDACLTPVQELSPEEIKRGLFLHCQKGGKPVEITCPVRGSFGWKEYEY